MDFNNSETDPWDPSYRRDIESNVTLLSLHSLKELFTSPAPHRHLEHFNGRRNATHRRQLPLDYPLKPLNHLKHLLRRHRKGPTSTHSHQRLTRHAVRLTLFTRSPLAPSRAYKLLFAPPISVCSLNLDRWLVLLVLLELALQCCRCAYCGHVHAFLPLAVVEHGGARHDFTMTPDLERPHSIVGFLHHQDCVCVCVPTLCGLGFVAST